MLWRWVASSCISTPYVLRTWCQKSPATFTRYVFCLTRTHPFAFCPVLPWRMLQVQSVNIESSNCQSWEWEGFWYLYKYTMLSPSPSLQPCFSPHQSPNLTWFGLVSWPSLTFRPKNLAIGSETVPGIWSLCCNSQTLVRVAKSDASCYWISSAQKRNTLSFVSVSCLLRALTGLPTFLTQKEWLPAGCRLLF